MTGRYLPHSWSLLTKIVTINLLVLLVAFLALVWYVLPLYEDSMLQQRRWYVASRVEMAYQLVGSYRQRFEDGELPLALAQERALARLQIMSVKDDYFWVHSLNLVMLMHPYEPALVGKSLPEDGGGSYNTRRLFVAMNRMVTKSGKGFIAYDWPKPGQHKPVPKLSYVRLFEPWGWVIGSGVYIDDIHAEVESLRHKVYVVVGMVLAMIIVFSVIAAARIKRPIQQSLELLQNIPEHYRPEPVAGGRLDESGRLLQSLIALVTKVTEAKNMAEAASAAKGEFLAQLSHEIRTPMNAISGLTELAIDQADSPQQRELLAGIQYAADHLLSLVNQVLDFSKLESGAVELEQVPFRLRQTLQATLLPFAVRARAKGIGFDTLFDDTLPESVVGDPVRLRQVVVNLVGNAVKFTSQGGITVHVEAGAPFEGQLELCISVKDTGIGIPREKIDQIFTPYAQAESSTTRKFGGTGLGLSIVRRLLEVMQGTITVDSQPGVGTTFQVTVPVRLPEEPDRMAIASADAMASQRVLVAEDSQINRLMLVKMLEKLGHVVDVAATGREAVERWKQGDITIILMDIQMPEMDGLEAARIIRSLEAERSSGHVPIIALTGQDSPEDLKQCTSSGMDLHLKKPVHFCELAAALRRMFE